MMIVFRVYCLPIKIIRQNHVVHMALFWETSWSVIQTVEGEACLSLLTYREMGSRFLRKAVPTQDLCKICARAIGKYQDSIASCARQKLLRGSLQDE